MAIFNSYVKLPEGRLTWSIGMFKMVQLQVIQKRNANSNNVSLKPSGWQGPHVFRQDLHDHCAGQDDVQTALQIHDLRDECIRCAWHWCPCATSLVGFQFSQDEKLMLNWHVEHPEHLNNGSVGKRSGETLWEISRLIPIPCQIHKVTTKMCWFFAYIRVSTW